MRKADYGKNSSGMSVATLGSMTAAMKAQHILANAAIRTEVTKISDAAGARGCIYGVVFPSAGTPGAARTRWQCDRRRRFMSVVPILPIFWERPRRKILSLR